jgi:hypothetical protein
MASEHGKVRWRPRPSHDPQDVFAAAQPLPSGAAAPIRKSSFRSPPERAADAFELEMVPFHLGVSGAKGQT